MTAPKKPQDHQAKAPTVKTVEGGREVTINGLTVTVADEALDDFELLDDLNSLEAEQKASRLPSILRRLVGDDYAAVLEALRDKKTGRVSVGAGSTFIKELFGVLNPN
ncbi:hypothetical protein ACL9RL_09310 [Plantibacter sp. Mn2098]|uniref:hypothetical protein n=1 Tax=Plantibacter sp. Mn2098 TaxID=3395266 RepID=UPI003BDC6042